MYKLKNLNSPMYKTLNRFVSKHSLRSLMNLTTKSFALDNI